MSNELFVPGVRMIGAENAIELTVEQIVYSGKGLARHEGFVVFIPEVLPGERVLAEIVARHKRHADARLISVLDASTERTVPCCPLYGTCPGCVYQHARYGEEIRIKQAQLVNFLERTAAWQNSVVVAEPVPSPLEIGYRNKIVLHTRAGTGTAPAVGYIGEDNKTLLDIAACPLALPAINQRLAELRSESAFMNTLPDGEDLTLRHTVEDGTLSWIGERSPGKERLTEQSPWGPMCVPRSGFFQVNPALIPALSEGVQTALSAIKPDIVVDMYCGSGLLSLAAGHAGVSRVVGTDIDERAIRCAQANARKLGKGEHVFVAGRVLEQLPQILKELVPTRTVLIADPPRRGMERPILDLIGESALPALLYVSCAADTLARDLNRLATFGFRLHSVRLFDMFPRTPYFESFAVLTR